MGVILRWVLVVGSMIGATTIYADQQWEVIRSGVYEGLADNNGVIVIPPVYEQLGWSDGSKEVLGSIIGYKEGIYWGLISLKNKKITSPKFTVLIPDGERVMGAVKAKWNNQLFYGLMDVRGEVKVGFNYFSISPLGRQLYKVSEYRNRLPHYGLIRADGTTVLACDFTDVLLLGDMVVVEKHSKKKLFNSLGKPVLDVWLDDISITDQGYLLFNEGKYGLVSPAGQVLYEVLYKRIDAQGAQPFNNWRILDLVSLEEKEVQCDSLTRNDEGFWLAHLNTVSHLLSPTSLPFLENQNKNLVAIQGSLLLMQDRANLKWSVYKEDGSAVLLQKDSIVLSEHYIFSQEKNIWDIYNHFGRKLNEYDCEEILGEQLKNIGVKRGGYWGWIDFNGDPVVRCKYDVINFGIDDQTFIIKYVDKWGVADFEDRFVIAPEYDRVEKVGGLYVAYKGYSKRIFSPSGKQVYLTASPVSGKDIVLIGHNKDSLQAVLPDGSHVAHYFSKVELISGYYRFSSGKSIALADSQGQFVVRFSDGFQEIKPPSEERFLIRKNGGYGFVDSQGRLRIANRYEGASSFKGGLAAVKLIGKWGFVDVDEQLVVQPFYDHVGDFQDGLSIVGRENLHGIINKRGEEIVEIKWQSIERQSSGNFVVKDTAGNSGLVDNQGGIIFAPLFESLKDTDEKLVIAQKSGKMGVMTYDGYTKYPFVYSQIQPHDGYLLFLK